MVILIGTLMEYTKRSRGVPYLGTPPVCLYMYMVCATIIERKLRSESTAVYRTLLFHNSCFLRTVEKNTLNLLLAFFVFL